MADQSDETPNPLVIEAFKPVIDAAIEFALLDDARRDGLDYPVVPTPISTTGRSCRVPRPSCSLTTRRLASARKRKCLRTVGRLLHCPRSSRAWPT